MGFCREKPYLKGPLRHAGDHTRSITVAKLSNKAGGIMNFAKVRLTCLACKAPLEGSSVDLCKHCRPKVCRREVTPQLGHR